MPETYTQTIGVEFGSKLIKLANGKITKAQIWDCAGNPRYETITVSHYRRAVGALLVYDISNEESFENLTSLLQSIREEADPNMVVQLVGNKLDLEDDKEKGRQVSRDRGSTFASENGLLF